VVTAFNDLLGRFSGLLEDMRRFTADASHQMRTPLSILRTHIALLRNSEPGSREADQSLDDLDEASERLQNLVIQLLALARADNAARAELQLERLDLNVLAEDVCADYAPAAIAAGLELHFDPLADAAMILSDPVLAKEMIANLIDNAIRYAGARAHVHVLVADQAAELMVAVEDNGPGIAPEHRQAVFSRFTRLNPHANKSGSGLGLPIAQSLANALQARMVLTTPASGTGLRAEIHFPRAPTE
jgi:two-component system sensor histidine kinase TctE